mmetsp:Transcript_21982/g.54772  ORF Transcript_21982/g.54772 Transcript_21982/m.54772 type:complete len:260 (-) Transcript_21982:94-873(-)|eukprot:CAMPEP_0182813106 /NCGR_PEP_ID=MMETSP0006_2-20121128/9161_1 /TAXON_ID=97485 /ORGANISM="Prymnesium parvum, Strain Texoma1" /LENGTH=259 /DNA_ID=CAMNT_0024939177 /DNA_START=25 /DNA_END=804 /DNA_ORIENTATION=-
MATPLSPRLPPCARRPSPSDPQQTTPATTQPPRPPLESAPNALSPGIARHGWTHFLVLDFEATCARDDPTQPRWSEIIEWPCVLLDARSLLPVAEFHHFVRPTERPVLTDFCTELTSITQTQVDAAEPLEHVLASFNRWLPQAVGSADSAVLAVTCGEPDLGQMLPRESARKGLEIPPVLRQYCNIKRPFEQLFGWKGGMVDMLQHLQLPLLGRHHLGIDDARNIARITARLIELGATVDVTEWASAWKGGKRKGGRKK